MRYLNATQVEARFEELTLEQQLGFYKKAFGIKEVYPQLSRVDCIACAMGFEKCTSGSGFYENTLDNGQHRLGTTQH